MPVTHLGFGNDGQEPGHGSHQHGAQTKDEVQGDVGDEGNVGTGKDSGDQIHPWNHCVSKKEKRNHGYFPETFVSYRNGSRV